MIHKIGGHHVDALPFAYKIAKAEAENRKPKAESRKPKAESRNLVQCITERVMEFANSVL